ncbi:MAG: hypothetical protein WC613_04450 [Candidatus Aenigmatarchaeota archaeon]
MRKFLPLAAAIMSTIIGVNCGKGSQTTYNADSQIARTTETPYERVMADYRRARADYTTQVKKYEQSLGAGLTGYYKADGVACRLGYSGDEPFVTCHTKLNNDNEIWTVGDGVGRVRTVLFFEDHNFVDYAFVLDKLDDNNFHRPILRNNREARDIQDRHDASTRKAIQPQNYYCNQDFWPMGFFLKIKL